MARRALPPRSRNRIWPGASRSEENVLEPASMMARPGRQWTPRSSPRAPRNPPAARALMVSIQIIVSVGAGTNLREPRDQVRKLREGVEPPEQSPPAYAPREMPRGHGPRAQPRVRLPRGAAPGSPNVAEEAHQAAKLQPWQLLHGFRQGHRRRSGISPQRRAPVSNSTSTPMLHFAPQRAGKFLRRRFRIERDQHPAGAGKAGQPPEFSSP